MTDSDTSSRMDREGGLTTVATGEELYLVTSNDAKYRQAVDVFAPEIALERAHVDVPELQSTDAETVVERKAEAAHTRVGAPVIVDDFSFFMDGLNEFPGPLVKHLLKETGPRGLRGLQHVSDAGCTLRCTVAICDGEVCLVARGELRGMLQLDSDYADPSADMLLSTVFVPDGYDRPLSELRIADHRHRAYSNAKDKLIE